MTTNNHNNDDDKSINSMINKEKFIEKTLSLLEIEKESEVNESVHLQSTLSNIELEQKGICIRKLRLQSISTGLGGRCLVKLSRSKKDETDDDLPPHKFTPGDIVGIRFTKSKPGQSLVSGVIYRVDNTRVTISLDDYNEDLMSDWENMVFAIDKLANDVTYRKMRDAVEALKNGDESSRADSRVINVIFNNAEPHQSTSRLTIGKPISSRLNETQIEAVEFALASTDIALIHGPPGTGKTTTVVEFIVQCVNKGMKVLACAPSNLAVDNMLEKLIAVDSIRPTRIGHPARIMEGLAKYTLDHKTKNGEEAEVVRGLRSEIAGLIKETRTKVDKDRRRAIGNALRDLRKDLRVREAVLVERVIAGSGVVLSTCTGAADSSLRHHDFDIVVIDEAGQALEAQCWIPIRKGKRLVLAGDHQQLPPTIHSEAAAKDGLEVTLFERLIRAWGHSISRLLSIQYRMHQTIMKWSSDAFYGGEMRADPSVATHLLNGLSDIRTTPSTTCPAILIDTHGCQMEESADEESESKFNTNEALVVACYVDKLVTKYNVPQLAIGVISPYNGQVKCLKAEIHKTHSKIEIGTIDGFQGREKEVIVISMVRSNSNQKVGFLSEDRRTNVAITRARRQVVIVANCQTISSYPFLKNMVDYFRTNCMVRSALEYVDTEEDKNEIIDDSSDEEVWELDSKKQSTSSTSSTVNDASTLKKEKKSIAELKKEKKMKKKDQQQKDQGSRDSVVDLERRQKELDAMTVLVDQFIKSSSTTYSLPPTLNSYQRLLVHELAEKYNLGHQSIGEGDQRQITLTKKIKKQIIKEKEEVEDEEEDDKENEQEEEIDEEKDTDDEIKDIKQPDKKDENNNNNKSPIKPKPQTQPQPKKKPAATTTNNNNSKKKKKEKVKSDKELGDELMEQFNNMDVTPIDLTVCGVKGCKTNVQILGRICEFCKRKYCNMHALFEIHGCGIQAKTKARKDWFDAYANGVQKETKSHSKLQSAIQDAESSRKKKLPAKKK